MTFMRCAALLALLILLLPNTSTAHKRGNHAGDWTPGQVIRVCVAAPPNPAYNMAVQDAINTWNNAKNQFQGGVTMMVVAGAPCDVQIDWQANLPGAWGSVSPGTDPVPVKIESNAGLTQRGVTRVLLHELGHVKGLGHSGLSSIMPWNFRDANANGVSAGELNGADALEMPNADDVALNKKLHGTGADVKARALASGVAVPTEDLFKYTYELQADNAPELDQPITRFSLELAALDLDFEVLQLPPLWNWAYFPGDPSVFPLPPAPNGGGDTKDLDFEEGGQPNLLTFWTDDPGFGIPPGGFAIFEIESPLPPSSTRAFTNSQSLDTDEFIVPTPAGPATGSPLAELSETSRARVHPNPFGQQVSLLFSLTRTEDVEITVHDVMGRRLATVLDAQMIEGAHVAVWDGRDASGVAVPSGVYFLRAQIGGRSETKKVTLIR